MFVVLIIFKRCRKDDGDIHWAGGKCQPLCFFAASISLEREHLQADVQRDAHLLCSLCAAEFDV